MKLFLPFLAVLLLPHAVFAQHAALASQSRPGVAVSISTDSTTQAAHDAAFTSNLIRGAAVGIVIGGIIGAFNSRHQPAAAGFTHTPAVLFVITYGGLGGLLGVIAGTLLSNN